MKKLSLYAVAALVGASLIACDDYKEPNPPAQYNPQAPVLNPDNVETEDVLSTAVVYDLEAMEAANQNIEIATASVEGLADGYTMGAVVYISNNNWQDKNPYQVPAFSELISDVDDVKTYNIYVSPRSLGEVYQEITSNPNEAEISIRYHVTVNGENTTSYAGEAEDYYTHTITIIPLPSPYVLEDSYYLLISTDDWATFYTEAYEFTHSEENVYDDPVFTIFGLNIPADWEGNAQWYIVPKSTYEAGQLVASDYGYYGAKASAATPEEGKLVPYLSTVMDETGNTVIPQSGTFTISGPLSFTVDMMYQNYSYQLAIPQLYTPGEANGWGFGDNNMILSTTNYVDYEGYVYLTGGYKLVTGPAWANETNGYIEYGQGDDETIVEDGIITGSIAAGGPNLSVTDAALYWDSVNISTLTYKLTPIETIGVVGDATPGGWDASTPLTPSDDFLTWSGDIAFNGSGEFKFRANNGWDVNLGGTYDNLVQGGANIPTPGAGVYTVTLDLSAVPYTCTVVAK